MRRVRQIFLLAAAVAAVSGLLLPLWQRTHPPSRPDFDTVWRACMDALIADVRRDMLLTLPPTRADIIAHVRRAKGKQ